MSADDVSRVAEDLVTYYESWRAPEIGQDAVRVSLASPHLLGQALLYADTVAIPDPVFEWLTNLVNLSLGITRDVSGRASFDYPGGVREAFADNVRSLLNWEPIVSRGIAIPVPRRPERLAEVARRLRSPGSEPLHAVDWFDTLEIDGLDVDQTDEDELIIAAVRARESAYDEAARDSQLTTYLDRAAGIKMDEVVPEIVAYVDAYAQAIASAARPVASDKFEWAYLLHRIQLARGALERRDVTRLNIVPALAASDLPFLQDVRPRTLLAIRTDEEAFREWRLKLSSVIRAVEALGGDSEFEDEAREVLAETLVPAAEAVMRATSKSKALKDAARESSLRLGVGATFAAAAAQAGAPAVYSMAAAGMSALIDLTVRAILRPSVQGWQTVLLQLLRS
jgi:hypothetical protein